MSHAQSLSPVELGDVRQLFSEPLYKVIDQARLSHRQFFADEKIQAASLLSIKTGGCPENCAYCPQSAHYSTGVQKTKLMDKESVLESARAAQELGASRFCMGAAWRDVKDGADFDHVIELVRDVHGLGLEVCCTLGMLSVIQARRLKEAGLYAYNHNIDTSREFYSKIIQTRSYDDRLRTIENVRAAGLTVCTGGILGMGESEEDRMAFVHQLASFDPQPESITVNTLVPIAGTPLEDRPPISVLEVVRVVAVLRIVSPRSMIRLSAGRLSMTEEAQFLCFLSGANSIFLGDKLLTSPNPTAHQDATLINKLGYQMRGTSGKELNVNESHIC